MDFFSTEIISAFFTGVLGPLALFITGKYFNIKNPLKKKLNQKYSHLCPIKNSIDFNQLIDDQLDNLMDELRCDRIWLIQFHNGGNFYPTGKSIQKFSTFYEHITPNTPSVKHIYQNIPVSIFNKPLSILYSNGEILIPDMGNKEMERLGLTSLSSQFKAKSSYIFALFDIKERYLGTLIVDYVKEKYVLSETEITYARQKSASIGSAINTYLGT